MVFIELHGLTGGLSTQAVTTLRDKVTAAAAAMKEFGLTTPEDQVQFNAPIDALACPDARGRLHLKLKIKLTYPNRDNPYSRAMRAVLESKLMKIANASFPRERIVCEPTSCSYSSAILTYKGRGRRAN